jgi:hypothetical protein
LNKRVVCGYDLFYDDQFIIAQAMEYIDQIINAAILALGLFVGYLFGRERAKKTQNKQLIEETIRVKESLYAEIKENYGYVIKGLEPVEGLRGSPIEWFRYSLLADIYDSVVNSGNFSLLAPEIQVSFSVYYKNVKKMNSLASNTGVSVHKRLYDQNISAMKECLNILKEKSEELFSFLLEK